MPEKPPSEPQKDSQHKRKSTALDQRIGKNLRTLRLSAGVSQQEIAALLNVSFQQVQKYEKGENRLSAGMLNTLKRFYGVPYERFFSLPGSTEGVPVQNTATNALLPEYDDLTTRICRDVALIHNENLKKKIRKIIAILAAPEPDQGV